MSDLFIGMLAGMFVGTVIVAVFGGRILGQRTTDLRVWRREAQELREERDLLLMEKNPQQWLEQDTQTTVKMRRQMKQKLYDRYENLVAPGTETIRIEDQDDIPPSPITYTPSNPSPKVRAIAEDVERSMLTEGWRNQIGQGGE